MQPPPATKARSRPAPPALFRVAAYVALHARRRPAHIAVIRQAGAITYAAFAQDLFAVIAALKSFDLPHGALAAIGLEDPYFQLLLVFGCEALGIVTGSFRPREGPDAQCLLDQADLIIADQPLPAGAAPPAKIIRISPGWFAAALAAPAGPPALATPAGPPALTKARPFETEVVFRSSGTTGAPKLMALTHAALRDRLARQRNPATGLGLTAAARYLALMHFAVGSTYMAASNTLRLGATFIGQSGNVPQTSPQKILATTRPTHLTLMPAQLRALLASLPPRHAPLLPTLTVQTVGAKLPPDLRAATLQKLAGQVRDTYGANEVGAVGRVDETGAMQLLPGVEVEIAGPAGQALPIGELGTIRIRSPGMVTAYLNDSAATAAMFRHAPTDGLTDAPWFHPGDLGILTAANRLTLAGRRNDILNLGGAKIAAPDLEAKILAHTNLRDVALLQRDPSPRQSGPLPIIICAVLADHVPTSQKQLQAAISPLLAYPFRIFVLDNIPRTQEGKIQRTRLHDKFFPHPVPTA